MNPSYPELPQIDELVRPSNHILIIQADNPDADSLGSALALEQLLGSLGKQTTMYCAVDMPAYLRYMSGWDRVENELPNSFDLSIIVDASTMTLLEKFQDPAIRARMTQMPCIVLDHHEITDNPVPFVDVIVNDGSRASTGELIYILAKQLTWPFDVTAGEYVMSSILGDTQGLSNELTSATTYEVMAELVTLGVNRPRLEETRRQYGKMPGAIFKYKAKLIDRTEFYGDGRIAIVTVPQIEITDFSPLYNPAPLIQSDMLMTAGVQVAIVLKSYDNGRITAAIRSNAGYVVAGTLASEFGGGGHQYASGFKVVDGRSIDEIKSACILKAVELLDALGQDNETI